MFAAHPIPTPSIHVYSPDCTLPASAHWRLSAPAAFLHSLPDSGGASVHDTLCLPCARSFLLRIRLAATSFSLRTHTSAALSPQLLPQQASQAASRPEAPSHPSSRGAQAPGRATSMPASLSRRTSFRGAVEEASEAGSLSGERSSPLPSPPPTLSPESAVAAAAAPQAREEEEEWVGARGDLSIPSSARSVPTATPRLALPESGVARPQAPVGFWPPLWRPALLKCRVWRDARRKKDVIEGGWLREVGDEQTETGTRHCRLTEPRADRRRARHCQSARELGASTLAPARALKAKGRRRSKSSWGTERKGEGALTGAERPRRLKDRVGSQRGCGDNARAGRKAANESGVLWKLHAGGTFAFEAAAAAKHRQHACVLRSRCCSVGPRWV